MVWYDRFFHQNVKVVLVLSIIGIVHITLELLTAYDIIDDHPLINAITVAVAPLHYLAFVVALILFKGQYHRHKEC